MLKYIFCCISLVYFNSNTYTQNTLTIPSRETVEEFYDAIFSNNTEKAIKMLNHNFPAKFEPLNKVPPVHAAIWQKNLTLLKELVKKGANIQNSSDNIKTTSPSAIEVAADKGNYEIVDYLIKQGCKINNNSAFNTAGYANNYPTAKLLLLNGANQELGDLRGKFMVFDKAIRIVDYETLNALNLNNHFINMHNFNGETGLIIAIKNKNIAMVKYLLSKGADKNIREMFDNGDDIKYGRKPIQIAIQMKQTEMISMLK